LNLANKRFAFDSFVAKINQSANTLSFIQGYAPIGLSSILPEGGLAADQGYYMVMTDQQTGGFNYNFSLHTNTVLAWVYYVAVLSCRSYMSDSQSPRINMLTLPVSLSQSFSSCPSVNHENSLSFKTYILFSSPLNYTECQLTILAHDTHIVSTSLYFVI